MENTHYDPELIHRRRLIINGVIAFIIIACVIYGWIWATHYHRTSTSQQQTLMASNEPVVVVFYSKTCPDCKRIALTVNRSAISGRITGEIRNLTGDSSKKHQVMFLEYQNKHDRELFTKYNVSKTPTFMVLKQGQSQVIKNTNGILSYQYSGNNVKKIKNIYHNLQVDPLLK